MPSLVRLRPIAGLLALSLAAAPAAAQRPAPAAAPGIAEVIRIPHERFTLPNGLTALLAVDRSTPTVAVDVWYHVGSKNEVAGRTGFAHLFEHVMFTGSGNIAYGVHDRLTMGVGGSNNGSTSSDRTNYYEVVPANYLETALWLEADRMGFLLDALDSAKFVAQRDIVQNERRQGVDNVPYGRVGEIMSEALYPAGHPYSWPVIGHMADLQAASLEDVKRFFRTWYAPNNATIAIVGDFDADSARTWLRKYFADVPRGRPIARPTVPAPVLAAEKRLVYEDRVQVPRLYLRWPTVGVKHADRHALSVLGAILSGSRTSRLNRALVFDTQRAASVAAGQGSSEDVGSFSVTVTPRPGNALGALEAAVDSVIARVKAEGPTADELTRAKAGAEFGLVSSLESNLGKAEMLLGGHVFQGDADAFRADLAALQAVTAADVRRVASRYLTDRRIVLSVVPLGKLDMAAKPEASTKVAATTAPQPETRQ